MNILWVVTGLLAAMSVFGLVGWYLAVRETARYRTIERELNQALLHKTSEMAGLMERARLLEDARSTMAEQFQLVSQQAMQTSSEALLKRAEEAFVSRERLALERVTHSLKPVSDTLARFEGQVKAMEEARHKDTGGLKAEIAQLLEASRTTKDVTQKLANALKRGAGVQGRWGEEMLRNVLNAAGLTRFDFTEQRSVDTEEGRRRPDVVVNLPGGVFVIDSKVNLTAYMEALEARDDEAREAMLMRHAHGLKAHIRDLSQKAYWDQFDNSPDFVALFIPGDGLLAAALDRMPHLLAEAMDKKVIIVTPTTLYALCKAVAYGWRIEDQVKGAREIAETGRELYARLSTMGDHVQSMGKSLRSTVDKYNQFIGSLETKVLTQARRFETLGVDHEGKSIPDLEAIETTPRPLQKLSHQAEPNDQDRLVFHVSDT